MASLRLKYLVPDYDELSRYEYEDTPRVRLKYMVPDYHDIVRQLEGMESADEPPEPNTGN